jgi:hypothetical protein
MQDAESLDGVLGFEALNPVTLQKSPEVPAKRGLIVNDKTERLIHAYLAYEQSSGLCGIPDQCSILRKRTSNL